MLIEAAPTICCFTCQAKVLRKFKSIKPRHFCRTQIRKNQGALWNERFAFRNAALDTNKGLQQWMTRRRWHCCADQQWWGGLLRDTFTQEDEYRGHWARREAHHRRSRVVYFWPAYHVSPQRGLRNSPTCGRRTLATPSGVAANCLLLFFNLGSSLVRSDRLACGVGMANQSTHLTGNCGNRWMQRSNKIGPPATRQQIHF